MTKILGLDLGTNSIGWAVRDSQTEGNQIIKKGAIIFPKGVGEDQTGEYSKARERTKHRASRRLNFRRKKRKTKLLKILIDNNMCPLSIDGWDKWANYKKGRTFKYPKEKLFTNWIRLDFNNDGEQEYKNPYDLRKKAVQNKLSPEQIGRAFYHICQRRGFKSNRLDQTSSSDNTKIHEGDSETNKTGINEVKKLIQESELGTLGAALADLNPHKNRIRNTYTAREDYLHEFEKICEIQEIEEELVDNMRNAIFYQRPLKSQKGNIGPCSFEFHWYYDKKNNRWRKSYARRCPTSHPVFEKFRMLSFINSIKISERGEKKTRKEFLTDKQKQKISSLFFRVSSPRFNFENIAKKLDPKRNRYSFNYKDYHTVAGCTTISKAKNIIGDKWDNLKAENKKNHLDNSNRRAGKNETSHEDIWHALFTFEDAPHLKKWGKKHLSLNDKEAEKFNEISLKQGYARLSLRALRKILPFLQQGILYSHAAFLANIEEVIGKEQFIKNKEKVLNDIQQIIDDHSRENKINYTVNSLISEYLDNFTNGLTTTEWLNKELSNQFGASEKNRKKTLVSVKVKFNEQIREDRNAKKFIKIERLDQKIKNYLADNFDVGDRDLEKLYHPSDIDIYPEAREKEDGKRYLGSPETGNFKNPMALKTLYELKHLVNYMIEHDVIDGRDKIIIEMARELNSANKRKAIERWNREREKENQEFEIAIKELFKDEYNQELPPSQTEEAIRKFRAWNDQNKQGQKVLNKVMEISNNDIKKYRLWKEQKGICIYTGQTIGIADLFDPNKFEIEHTLPRSQSFDNSLENLSICDIRYNRDIKKTKIPTQLQNFDKDISINGTQYTAITPRLRDWEEKVKDLDKQLSKYKYPWGTESEEQKNRRIQKKHLLRMRRDYWSEKLYRFQTKNIKSGFKNSQLIDTQIVTKYARAYMKTVFNKVYTVKGSAVAEFRKLWGLQDEFDKKERTSHIHHTIDAAVISCLTKDKYDRLAHYYHNQEMYEQGRYKEKPFFHLPWQAFVSDLENFENETLIVHKNKDKTLKQTKRKLRKAGKIQYKTDKNGGVLRDKDGNKIPKYEKGMGIRGQLHLETFYGAIKRPKKDKKGDIKTDDKGKPQTIVKYVVNRPLEYSEESSNGFNTAKQLENIVDPAVRKKVLDHVKSNSFKSLKDALGHTVWMNKEKKIPIKRVRCFANDVKNPLRIKEQSHKSEGKRKKHKEFYYAKNKSNYLMALYDNGKTRDFELVNLFDVSKYHRLDQEFYPVQKDKKWYGKTIRLPLMRRRGKAVILKPNLMVLIYKEEENYSSLTKFPERKLSDRLYIIRGVDKDGIKLYHHQEARKTTDIIKYMNEVINKYNIENNVFNKSGKPKKSKLTTPKGGDEIFDHPDKFPYIKRKAGNFNGLIEGIDFKVSPIGVIKLVDDIS